MRSTVPFLAVLALAIAACGSTSQPSDSAPAADAGPWLSATFRQAIPPVDRFAQLPAVTITHDGFVLSPGPVPAIFPGPLVSPIIAREISDAGRSRILEWARDLGLLAGPTDFTGGATMPGQPVGAIRLTVDGQVIELTGDPSRVLMCIRGDCDPAPGTPEAFAALWLRLADLSTWLGEELGREGLWRPDGYALLVGPPPVVDVGPIRPQIADWPLPVALGSFGQPAGDGVHRCGTIRGAEAAALQPALEAANQLTQWVQDPSTSATFGLAVRPLLPGENVCRDLFGA